MTTYGYVKSFAGIFLCSNKFLFSESHLEMRVAINFSEDCNFMHLTMLSRDTASKLVSGRFQRSLGSWEFLSLRLCVAVIDMMRRWLLLTGATLCDLKDGTI